MDREFFNNSPFIFSQTHWGVRMYRALLIVSFVLFPTISQAQDKVKYQFSFEDGSVVWGQMKMEEVQIRTLYGKLTIPLSDIKSIKMDSNVYAERDKATNALKLYTHRAFPHIAAAMKSSSELELTNRCKDVMDAMQTKHGDKCHIPNYDIVNTKEGSYKGQLELKPFKIHTDSFGESEVDPVKLTVLRASRSGSGVVQVDAQKGWLDTEINIEQEDELVIVATGQVDLWPQGPGQYMAAPKGYNTAGKGGQFMAGALVAKVETSEEFLIGEKGTVTGRSGRLYLKIIESPWNNVSSGTYNVEIVSRR